MNQRHYQANAGAEQSESASTDRRDEGVACALLAQDPDQPADHRTKDRQEDSCRRQNKSRFPHASDLSHLSAVHACGSLGRTLMAMSEARRRVRLTLKRPSTDDPP